MTHIEDNTGQFIQLIVANQKKIFAFILCLVPIKMDAEDILQETLTEMWKKFDLFQPGSDFAAWGVQIARFKIMNYRKKCANRKVVFSSDIHNLLQNDFQRQSNLLHSSIDAIRTCVNKLSSNEKVLLKLRYEQDQTFKAISLRIGRSTQAVYKAISLIHVRLARCIKLTLAGGQHG